MLNLHHMVKDDTDPDAPEILQPEVALHPPAPAPPKMIRPEMVWMGGKAYRRGELSGVWYEVCQQIDFAYWERWANEARAYYARRKTA